MNQLQNYTYEFSNDTILKNTILNNTILNYTNNYTNSDDDIEKLIKYNWIGEWIVLGIILFGICVLFYTCSLINIIDPIKRIGCIKYLQNCSSNCYNCWYYLCCCWFCFGNRNTIVIYDNSSDSSSFYSLYSNNCNNEKTELEQIEQNFIIISPEINSDYCIINTNQEDSNQNKLECAICLQELNINENNDIVMLRKCNHYYHKGCITTWLKENKKCPLCRRSLNLD